MAIHGRLPVFAPQKPDDFASGEKEMVKGQITEYFIRESTRERTHSYCNRCKNWKPKRAFGKNKNFPPDFLARECRDCHNTRNRRSNISQQRIRKTKFTNLKKKYEINESQYFGRLQETNYKCPMCDKKLKHIDDDTGFTSNVDHVPGTGVIYLKNKKTVPSGVPSVTRGLLCDDCNNCIGRGKDNMVTLVKGAQYLMKWGARHNYLTQKEIRDYKLALEEASRELDRGKNDWDPTYRT